MVEQPVDLSEYHPTDSTLFIIIIIIIKTPPQNFIRSDDYADYMSRCTFRNIGWIR